MSFEIEKNRYIVVLGKTGSGKTVAFGIPLLLKLDLKRFHPQAIVLTPTRELADQVAKELRKLARKINDILKPFFADRGLNLIDFKLEFGKTVDGEILLVDEISPDSCRFWDMDTNEKLDKDVFRQDLGSVKVAYEEVLRRILNK